MGSIALAGWLAGCDGAGTASPSNAPAPSPDALLVRGAEVGPGIQVEQIPGAGTVAGTVTLDLCMAGYPSEALRAARTQVNYLDPSIGKVAASNEVVRYRPGGAAQAYTELKAALAHCPPAYPEGPAPAVTISQVGLEPPSPRLLPAQLTVAAMATLPDGTTAWSVSVYQFDGDYLSAIYTGRPRRDQALAEARLLGAVAADRLHSALGG